MSVSAPMTQSPDDQMTRFRFLDIVVWFDDVRRGDSLDDDGQTEADNQRGGDKPKVDAAASARLRRRSNGGVLDDCDRLRSRERTIRDRPGHQPPRQKHQPERDEAD